MLKFLKRHSRLKLKKEPNICNAEMVGPQDTPAYLYLTRVKGIITFQFAGRNMKVCMDWGITEEKKGFGGNKNFGHYCVKNQEFYGYSIKGGEG